ncbi:MBL fold metallo-hydrolase, partial [Bacteroides salyersiae]
FDKLLFFYLFIWVGNFSNYLFTGDSYIPNVKLVTNLPRSNKEKAKKSLERILGLIKDDTIVCPGHGAIIKNGY